MNIQTIILILAAIAVAEAVAAFKCTGCPLKVTVMIAIIAIASALILLGIDRSTG